MNGYLDLHTHILPGVDDGAKDMAMSMEMIQKSYEEGVRFIIATPHYYMGYKNASVKKLEEQYENVKSQVEKIYPDMKLFLGNEILYKEGVLEHLKEKRILTLANTRYVLVEFNISLSYAEISKAIRSFVLKGYYPIIAHGERYQGLYQNPQGIEELISLGAYIQINTETFMAGFFDKTKKFWIQQMNQGQVHFLGSDTHNLDSRKPLMEQAIRQLRKKIDNKILNQILYSNTECLLNNKFI